MNGRPLPERTCVGCRGTAPKPSLLRIVRGPDGRPSVDPTGSAPGRGAYVHRTLTCVAAATSRGRLARALRAGLPEGELVRLRSEIEGMMR